MNSVISGAAAMNPAAKDKTNELPPGSVQANGPLDNYVFVVMQCTFRPVAAVRPGPRIQEFVSESMYEKP